MFIALWLASSQGTWFIDFYGRNILSEQYATTAFSAASEWCIWLSFFQLNYWISKK